MGFISGAMRRGLSGAGAALEVSGLKILQSELDEARQARLMELQEGSQARRDERQNAFASGQTDKQIAATQGEGKAGRDLQREIAGNTDKRITDEGRLNREHTTAEAALNRTAQENIAKLNETAATGRHNASMGIQLAQLKELQSKVTLLPQADGTFQRIKSDGTNMGTLTDLSGNPIQGPKDVSASSKVLIDGNSQVIKGLMTEHAKVDDPKVQSAIMQQVQQLQRANEMLAKGMTPAAGQTPTSEPPQGAIDALRKNPKMADEFRAKYNVDPAQFLTEPGKQPDKQPDKDDKPKPKPTPTEGAAPRSPLEEAWTQARERAERDIQGDRDRARGKVTSEIDALNGGQLDAKSQDNYRRLFALKSSPAISTEEKTKIDALLRQY